MILRVLELQWTPFADALCARRDVESAGVVLAERLRGGQVFLARHLLPVPDDGYMIRRIDQLRIDPLALNRLIRPARDGAMSVLTVHTHPMSNRPWFSIADDAGDSRLMPSLFAQMPGPHGSIVIAGDTREPAARMWSERGTTVDVVLRIVGKTIQTRAMAYTAIGETLVRSTGACARRSGPTGTQEPSRRYRWPRRNGFSRLCTACSSRRRADHNH